MVRSSPLAQKFNVIGRGKTHGSPDQADLGLAAGVGLQRGMDAPPILFPFQNRISSDLSLSMDQPALYSPPPTAIHSDPPVAPPSHRWRVTVTLAARRWRVGGAWMVRPGGDCSENPRKIAACNGVNLRPVTLPLVWRRGDGLRTDPKPPHPAALPCRHHPLAIDRNRWRS